MEPLKIGVFGISRGYAFASELRDSEQARVVAICDRLETNVEWAKLRLDDPGITYYASFDDFIEHDMDVVVLANYATEHAPYAIRCLDRGMHVISELLPFQTMQEAVELADAVDRSGKVYAYAENCCYMLAPYEMRRLYREGRIGEFRYGECEYLHRLSDNHQAQSTYGERDHWRNNLYSTFYCTHSLGPIIHITGLRPVSVTGFELPCTSTVGKKAGDAGIEMVTLENGAIVKSTHGNLTDYSLWWALYGTKGAMESARYATENGRTSRIFINNRAKETDQWDAPVDVETYIVNAPDRVKNGGHGGGDYNFMDHFIRAIGGDPTADIIGYYEACDMFLPGLLAYRSLLRGGVPVEIPDLRDPRNREPFRNDRACTDPKVAGDQLIPCCSKGVPDFPDEVYERVKAVWQRFAAEEEARIKREIEEMKAKKQRESK